MEPIIKVKGISKRYRVGSDPGMRYGSLRESLARSIKAPLRLLSSRSRSNGPDKSHFWALNDIGFEVERGEVLGLIGSNGAGKSTLLKVLSRITRPTTGRVELYGRVRSLLEVGTGFHPELSGRENVFLNGAILGMRRAETARKFDEIVAFAEVEKFIDSPVKHYSSGMYVRLAFAVAAYLEPEILLVDEVLAVGDARFWSKSIQRMRELNRQGSTIVLVSHNMFLMQTMASRALWLRGGEIAGYGKPLTVIGLYRQASEKTEADAAPSITNESPIRIDNLELIPESRWASPNEALPDSGIRVKFTVDCGPGKFMFHLRVNSPDGLPFFTVYSDPSEIPRAGRVTVEALIPRLMLMPGEYRIWVAICSEAGGEHQLANDSLPLKIASPKGTSAESFSIMWNEATWRVSKP
ncbi:MAG: ABC transporter ATP-binding protein [Candidatus Binatus sp.]|jgi:ABC-type polysaccharide/polyol phosphate transport system ATPase subunit